MVEGGETVVDPLESSAARLLGQGAAAPGWTRPATGTEQENQGCYALNIDPHSCDLHQLPQN